ncbi:MAG: hypothetical protein PHT53_03435 [Candidatus Omnitrophica bacterium]|nr:hypothetical protein [Candidatus Omnitrophota bacterium]
MKWVSATIRAVILFSSFIALKLMFDLVMQIGMGRWKDSSVGLGVIPKAAISLHFFITHYAMIIGSIVLVFCFALPFIEAARKK